MRPHVAATAIPQEISLLKRLADEALKSGRADVAGDLLRSASRYRPARPDENPKRLHEDAVKLLAANRLNEAEPQLHRAIQLNPTNPLWHEHLAVLFARQRRFAEAASTFHVALALDPAPASRWHLLALTYTDMKEFSAAELTYREAILRAPESIEIHAAAGLLLVAQEKFAPAIPHFKKVVQLNPKSVAAYTNLAAALGKLKRLDECEQASRAAIAVNPNHAPAWSNLGNCLRDLGRLEEAGNALATALKLDPNASETAGHFALTLAAIGQHPDALRWYDHCLKIQPVNDEVRFNRSLSRLILGDFSNGWAEYDHRWESETLRGKKPKFPIPQWNGEPLVGKRILLTAEQGLGDYIQFVRYAKPLAELGATVLVQPPVELQSLVRTLSGIGEVIENATAEATFHTYCPMLSLPRILKHGLPDFRGEPYMTPPAEAVSKWKRQLARVPGFKVGIAWQGNPKHRGDRWRSVKLERFARLAGLPGVTLVSVQKGHGREQIENVAFPLFDFGDELSDLGDTAGLLANLDLLISIDSAVVHLAGAIGTRTWNAISFNNDWRWLRDRKDTPWYNSMTLFRQPKMDAWDNVFAELENELRTLIR
jgi:tetratricopeptide (TPR) repeat protein